MNNTANLELKDFTREDLLKLVENSRVDLGDTWANKYLSGQKDYTHRLAKIPMRELNEDTFYLPRWKEEGVANNRLFRFLSNGMAYKSAKASLVLSDGTVIESVIKRQVIDLKGTPVLYVEFAENGDAQNQKEAYELSVKDIKEGIVLNGVKYEYAYSSGSQLRQLKGVFIRSDYKLSEEFLCSFDLSIPGCEEYVSFLRSLSGAEAIVEVMTYGAYSHEFSNRFDAFLGLSIEDKFCSISKFMARVGMAGTSSESLGNKWRVLRMGDVKMPFTREIEEQMLNYQAVTAEGKTINLYTKKDVEVIKRLWKENKWDGQSMIRLSTVLKALRELGIKLEREQAIGLLLQIRWAGVKGTAVVIEDSVLDACRDMDGKHIYRNYDIIVENSSWKYSPTKYYTGKLAPNLELVNFSKDRYTNALSSQAIMALDGNPLNQKRSVDVLTSLVDKQVASFKEAMLNADVAKVKLGVTAKTSPLEALGIDEYAMTQRNKITKAISVSDDVVRDIWFRNKTMDLFHNLEKDIRAGRIEVEGANRYIVSDIVGPLRTDLGVYNEETGLTDIVITSIDQLGIRGFNDCFWDSKEQEAVLFRSPCVHPGEPSVVNLVNNIPEVIHTAYGDIHAAKMYKGMRNILVINAISSTLEYMGGADTDGDTVLIVLDKDIVSLRDKARKPLLVAVDSETKKDPVNMDTIRNNMIYSLKNNGIGLITNYATTWRDIQLTVLRKQLVPYKIKNHLEKMKKAAIKNLAINEEWVVMDPSINAIANMDTNSFRSVYQACNSALRALRILQEVSINTAKSGVFVEFGGEDTSVNNNNHLAIALRANWHKPENKEEFVFESFSPMSYVSKYITKEWKELRKWANSTSSSILPEAASNYGPEYKEVLKGVNALRKYYGDKMLVIQSKRLSKERFTEEYGELTSYIHSQLTILACKYGVDIVAVASYDASTGAAARSNRVTGAAFAWNCYFDELCATIKHLSEDKITHKLHKVFLNAKYTYEIFKEGGPGEVIDGVVFLDGHQVGTSNLVDGEYEIVAINGALYIKVAKVMESIEKLEASVKGIRFNIIGFKFRRDLILGTNELLRENAIKYIESDINKNILLTKAITLPDTDKVVLGVYVKTPMDTHMLIGVIPSESTVISKTLNMKAIRVKTLLEETKGAGLLVEITDVIGNI